MKAAVKKCEKRIVPAPLKILNDVSSYKHTAKFGHKSVLPNYMEKNLDRLKVILNSLIVLKIIKEN